ncbi:MAG: replicative DNA helicase [Candidatus Hydrogenedentes bacterium]|nr:replicative DNA helicase [Candidatus Hydrogenedentota bacterium]
MRPAKKRIREDYSKLPTFDREPPKSIEAERAVLGAILLSPDTLTEILDVFGESRETELFYYRPHQQIYNAIFQIFVQTSHPPEISAVAGFLEARNLLVEVGGISYLAELRNAVVSLANVKYYANIVLETALLRKLIQRCNYLINKAYESETEVKELLDEAEHEIFTIATQRKINPIFSVATVAENVLQVVDERARSGKSISGLNTGYDLLDDCLSGLQRADMIVLAARPSVGKTAFALNLAKNIGVEQNKGVLIFSLEMSKEQLVQRLICMLGGFSSSVLRKSSLAKREMPSIVKAVGDLKNAPIYIDDTPSLNVLELRSKARRHLVEHSEIELIIIDYLQLMNPAYRGENRQVEIAEISRHIKGLARELNVPILTLCQLSREAEKETSSEPKLAHLRESGAIEQDADVVMMLYIDRPEKGKKKEKDNYEDMHILVHLKIAKHRNGPLSYFDFDFNRETQIFTLYAPDYVAESAPPVRPSYVEKEDGQ